VTAAHHGTDEIGLAVTATTLAIAVVFVPVAFMGGVAEQWFAPFALTIVCSVLVSWLVSFSVDPMLSAYWSDRQPRGGHRSRIHGALATFNAWFQDRSDSYETVVGWALDHRWSIIVLAVSSFAIGLALPAFGIVGGSFLPVHDVSEFTVVIEARPGSSLAYTKLKAAEVARRVRSRPEVAYTYATIGDRGSGAQNSASVDEAAVYVRLKPKAERDRHQEDIEQWVRRELRQEREADSGPGARARREPVEADGRNGSRPPAAGAWRRGYRNFDQRAEAGTRNSTRSGARRSARCDR
jgi:HAE1 family hydrophobic/amphiphilic exporter-1